MKKAPCRECPDREVGCHVTCETYLEWAKEYRQERIGNGKMKTPAIHYSHFTGTSPKPGKHRRTRRT